MLNKLINRVTAPAQLTGAAKPQPEAPAAKPAKKAENPFGRDVLNFTSRDQDTNGFLTSDEYGTGKAKQAEFFRHDSNHDGKLTYAEATQGVISDLYEAHLGRTPDAEGLKSYTQQIEDGRAVTEIEAEIAQSPEAQARQPEQIIEPSDSVAETAPVEEAPAATGAGETHHISQYAPQGQDAAYDEATAVWNESRGVMQPGFAQCGATSSAMAMRAFGYGEGMTDAQLILEMGGIVSTSKTDGTGAYNMQQGLDSMDGFHAELAGPGANVDWIRQKLESGEQVIANGDYFAMAPHENWGAVGTGGHYVSVVGLDDSGNFLVHDPAYNNGGEPIVLTGDQLATFINSNTNGGFQVSVGRDG